MDQIRSALVSVEHFIVAQDEGDEKMVEIAEHVRQGARAYLNRQYKVVTIFFMASGLQCMIIQFPLAGI